MFQSNWSITSTDGFWLMGWHFSGTSPTPNFFPNITQCFIIFGKQLSESQKKDNETNKQAIKRTYSMTRTIRTRNPNMTTTNKKRPWCYMLLMLACSTIISDAFVVTQQGSRNHRATTKRHHQVDYQTGLQMFSTDTDFVFSNSLLDKFRDPSMSLQELELATTKPEVEAGFFSGMSHLALDFSGLLNPSRQLLRLCSVIGRVFVLCADYVPDHSIQPTEFGIQLLLLSLAMKDFIAMNNNSNNNQNYQQK